MIVKYIKRLFPIPVFQNGSNIIYKDKIGNIKAGRIINANRYECGKVEYRLFDDIKNKYINIEEKHVLYSIN